jgi:hypothetical protein
MGLVSFAELRESGEHSELGYFPDMTYNDFCNYGYMIRMELDIYGNPSGNLHCII